MQYLISAALEQQQNLLCYDIIQDIYCLYVYLKTSKIKKEKAPASCAVHYTKDFKNRTI